jgi:hypothetical protein
MCICDELDKFLLFNLIKQLVTGHNPFSEKALKLGLIPRTLIYGISRKQSEEIIGINIQPHVPAA